jgi:hypothetical protein
MVGQVELSKLIRWHNELGAGVILAPGSTFVASESVKSEKKMALI